MSLRVHVEFGVHAILKKKKRNKERKRKSTNIGLVRWLSEARRLLTAVHQV